MDYSHALMAVAGLVLFFILSRLGKKSPTPSRHETPSALPPQKPLGNRLTDAVNTGDLAQAKRLVAHYTQPEHESALRTALLIATIKHGEDQTRRHEASEMVVLLTHAVAPFEGAKQTRKIKQLRVDLEDAAVRDIFLRAQSQKDDIDLAAKIEAAKVKIQSKTDAEILAMQNAPSSFSGPEPLAIAKQLENLASCGIFLRSDLSKKHLFIECEDKDEREASLEEAEKDPYLPLLYALALPYPECGDIPKSLQLWRLDTEDVDYAEVAKEMTRLADGDFPLVDIASSEYGEEDEWVSFKLHGQTHKWPFAFDGWMEEEHMNKFSTLFDSLETGKRFAWISPGDQTILICCLTPDQRDKLAALIGQDVSWLTD